MSIITLEQSQYPKLLSGLSKQQDKAMRTATLRHLARTDLYFLLRYLLNRPDIEHPWLFARCREVQYNPNEHLDLWAREHYKSTIITFAKTIQDILASHGDDPLYDREFTFGLFSFNAGTALKFVQQVKQELETNKVLIELFPDILYENPNREAQSWSVQGGLVVRRNTNPKEATLAGHGLVDSMPTGSHYWGRLYDDVITERFARTPEMIQKATESWELSLNLGARGGFSRYIGTRYHYNDPYRVIMQREAARPRIYPATKDGKIEGEPVFLTQAELAKKRREQGPYTFACHAANTMVLLPDWTQKPIQDIRPGDYVIGYQRGSKTRLVSTKVLAVNKRTAPAKAYTLESGHIVKCTPDHKWWHGRWRENSYSPIEVLGGICRIVPDIPKCPDVKAAGYLAGMIDADGSISGGTIHIYQSEEINPSICKRIRETLTILGIPWNEHYPRCGHVDFFLTGGKDSLYKVLTWCQPEKSDKIAQLLTVQSKGSGYRSGRDKLVSSQDLGDIPVYNIQTETGNYVANGYASKNCQMMQDPKADETQGFKREWCRYYERGTGENMNRYILVDPANEKKKGSDYTAIGVIGLGMDQNYYLLDAIYDRLNLDERTKALFALHRRWKPLGVGYEKYGKDTDIEHIEYVMKQLNYRFDITPLGGHMAKIDRIKRLIPLFSDGRFYLPKELIKQNYEGQSEDLIEKFMIEEYDPFPVSVHDDFLDMLSRICEEDLQIIWPQFDESVHGDRYARAKYQPKRRKSWRSA